MGELRRKIGLETKLHAGIKLQRVKLGFAFLAAHGAPAAGIQHGVRTVFGKMVDDCFAARCMGKTRYNLLLG